MTGTPRLSSTTRTLRRSLGGLTGVRKYTASPEGQSHTSHSRLARPSEFPGDMMRRNAPGRNVSTKPSRGAQRRRIAPRCCVTVGGALALLTTSFLCLVARAETILHDGGDVRAVDAAADGAPEAGSDGGADADEAEASPVAVFAPTLIPPLPPAEPGPELSPVIDEAPRPQAADIPIAPRERPATAIRALPSSASRSAWAFRKLSPRVFPSSCWVSWRVGRRWGS
jgi:hypothetical protein